MGIISKGILGPFSGTVGTVIGATWKGVSYMRSKPTLSPGREPSVAQLEQQYRFKAVINFLQPMLPLVHFSFKEFAVHQSGFNSAVSYNLKNAVTGSFPNYEVDYSVALVSRGDLPNGLNPTAGTSGNTLTFNWTDNTGVGKAAATDKAIPVVYCPERRQCIFDISGERSAGTTSLNVAPFAGLEFYTWLSFISANSKNVATSVYTGNFPV